MKKINSNFLIFIILFFLVLPSIQIIFFAVVIPIFVFFILYHFLIMGILITIIIYFRSEKRKYFRSGVTFLILLIITIFVYTFRDQQNLGEIIYFKKNESDLNEFVLEIKKHPEVKYFNKGDSYEEAHKKNNIDVKTYDDYRKRLDNISCIYYEASSVDGSIAFINGGFIAHRNGVMYYEGKDKVYGAMLWKKVADNWYIWGD
ncbi:MAG: hypothetical protein K1X86_09015 [Ignavibacteria bacterium]|nr:hypothetical protein [Ignavibacteria bacterium]